MKCDQRRSFRTVYLPVYEIQKTYENSLLTVKKVKEQAKRKLELLHKPFLYQKQKI